MRVIRIFDGDVHLLNSGHISRQIFLETARNKCSCGVFADEEVIATSGTVNAGVRRDINDCTVQSQVDGQRRVRPVVKCELRWCEIHWSLL